VEAQIGARRYANLVSWNYAEIDSARWGTVDDDRLARRAQAMIFIEVGSDLAAATIGDPDHCRVRAHSCKDASGSQQNRQILSPPLSVGEERSDSPSCVYPLNYGSRQKWGAEMKRPGTRGIGRAQGSMEE
jgi:hypothetical protein